MANLPIEELFKRTVELNLRYTSALGKLASDYMQDIVSAMNGIVTPADQSVGANKQPPPQPQQSVTQMVLEAYSGENAYGVFLVENQQFPEVNASVVASRFTDNAGNEIHPKFIFDPASVILRKGEQALVRVQVKITSSMEPNNRYHGEFLIPSMQGTRVPVVLSRKSKPKSK